MHLAHHLTNDNLEVLVVNLHTLETVYVLYFVDDVLLYSGGTLDGKDVARSDDTVGKWCAGTHSIVLLNKDLLAQRNEVLALVASLAGDNDFTITALHLTHRHLTVDFRNDCGVGRITSLEEFGYTWKTTGDVTSLTHCTRNLHKCGTGRHGLTVFHNYVATHREVVGSEHLTIGVKNIASRNLALVTRFGDNLLGKTCGFVGLGLIGNTGNNVVEAKGTLVLGHDDSIERVPLGNEVALLHGVAVLEVE